MIDLLEIEKQLLLPHIKESGVAVDFTMGNGHDTLWLSSVVGKNGKVFSFDIQQAALENTKKLLNLNEVENVELILDSHSNVKKYITEKICAGMFNLGYMPGSGHKELTTMRKTTLPAVKNALGMLGRDAILLVAVYPGHAEGAEEGRELEAYFSTLSRYKMTVAQFRMLNSPASPYFMICETKA
ncbi:MAG: class I SAM-dependent methyltransferase [Clostridia bacterium]|nr:class I SAM-dependent methyltransferase [Clostridia bacterium]